MSYIHLLCHRFMNALGSESVRRSFDADVVFLKSKTPRRYCVHNRITLLRAGRRITALLIENAHNGARIGSPIGIAPDGFQPSQRLIYIVVSKLSARRTERITGSWVKSQSR